MSEYQAKKPIPLSAKKKTMAALAKAMSALSCGFYCTAAAEAATAHRILMRMAKKEDE